MFHLDCSPRGCPHSGPSLIQYDLCARLAPLDRYGLADFSSALVDVLRALASRSLAALRAIGGRARA